MNKNYSILVSYIFLFTWLLMMTSCSQKEKQTTLPTLTTSDISNITQISVICGGSIISDGGAIITSSGICWSDKPTPTILNNKLEAGIGYKTFSFKLSGLTPNRTYYINSFAVNSEGISYGAEKSFKTLDTLATVIDIDGNIYKTVTIGKQVWMAENLKTTRYRNGDTIQNISSNTAWCALKTGAVCWYDNKANLYSENFGAIYNWRAVNTGKLAPYGWHVPTDAEWKTLILFMGGELNTAGKLKTTGTYQLLNGFWLAPNTEATNEYGFSAVPGGYRFSNTGTYGGLYSAAGWWSSTIYDNTQAWMVTIGSLTNNIGRMPDDCISGFSIRCVKN